MERLYLVTDRRLGDVPTRVAQALADIAPGEVLVQLREKDLEGRALMALAEAVREVTRRAGARLLLNDRLDVALACGADGAHLPDDGLPIAEARALAPPGFLLGASAHGAEEAVAKARAGADLVTLGPIWDTPSKAGYGPPLGLEPLRRAASGLTGTALFAIGGVDSPARASEARRAGAHGVAVIRAAFGAADPGAASRALLEASA